MIGPAQHNEPGPAEPAFRWRARVYYEDTDAIGVVYHTAYLRFMERARTEWLRALGFHQSRLRRELGIAFAVRALRIEYKRPAVLDDDLSVDTRIKPRRRTVLDFEHHIRRINGDRSLVCCAAVEVVCMDATSHRPRAVPGLIVSELAHVG